MTRFNIDKFLIALDVEPMISQHPSDAVDKANRVRAINQHHFPKCRAGRFMLRVTHRYS
jgi:hypothetical protein